MIAISGSRQHKETTVVGRNKSIDLLIIIAMVALFASEGGDAILGLFFLLFIVAFIVVIAGVIIEGFRRRKLSKKE